LKKAFNFTRQCLNRALSVKARPCTVPNPLGIYGAQFKAVCPYSGERRRVFYYFRQDTNNNQPPDDPQCALDIFDKYASSNQLQRNCIRLGSNMPNVGLELGGEGGGGGGGGGEDGERGGGMNSNSTRTPVRARGAISKLAPNANDITPARGAGAVSAITPGNDDGQVNDVGGEVGCQVGSVVGSNVGSSLPLYWDSPEAAKLFGFSYKNGDDVYTGLQQIIELLLYTQQSHDGYKRIVAHVEREPLTPKQIFHIQNQCLYLRTAYSIALTKMGLDSNTWIGTCCKEAVKQLSSLGFNLTLDPYWLDFNKGFIVTSLTSGKDFDLKKEVEIGPCKKKRGRKQQKNDT